VRKKKQCPQNIKKYLSRENFQETTKKFRIFKNEMEMRKKMAANFKN
jgi:hypothetical protein